MESRNFSAGCLGPSVPSVLGRSKFCLNEESVGWSGCILELGDAATGKLSC